MKQWMVFQVRGLRVRLEGLHMVGLADSIGSFIGYLVIKVVKVVRLGGLC